MQKPSNHSAPIPDNGIETFFRFAKRDLLLDKFQPLDAQYLHNWMYILILACWLLFTARHVTIFPVVFIEN